MKIINGRFYNVNKGEFTNVYVVTTRGRKQYRMGSPKGDLIGSGMTPVAFMKRFWMREDFMGEGD